MIIYGIYTKIDMILSEDSIASHIPYYLTEDAKQGLLKELSDFPEKINYYTTRYPNDILQGDGMAGLQIINFDSGERKFTKGILLSNSCDIDTGNYRDLPIKMTFAPLIKIDKYTDLLIKKGIDKDKIDGKIRSIKEQKVTHIFFLPKNDKLDADYMALLSDLQTVPLNYVSKNPRCEKLFTLSQVGFYMFIFKLSVHFCRFHENVAR